MLRIEHTSGVWCVRCVHVWTADASASRLTETPCWVRNLAAVPPPPIRLTFASCVPTSHCVPLDLFLASFLIPAVRSLGTQEAEARKRRLLMTHKGSALRRCIGPSHRQRTAKPSEEREGWEMRGLSTGTHAL